MTESKKAFLSLVLAVLIHTVLAQSGETIKLYPGIANGSELWSINESTIKTQYGDVIINVTNPTLTFYEPKKSNSKGTSVIILPGGAMHMLDIEYEGTVLAQYLADNGINAFVLKYRLVQTTNLEQQLESAMGSDYEKIVGNVMSLAIEDTYAAVEYLRNNADLYKINKNHIGVMGFSAGAQITMAAAYNAVDNNRPNFISAIYGTALLKFVKAVPKSKMPAFFVVAGNDELNAMPFMLEQYKYWISGGQKAEMHVYQEGKHGFGMRKYNITTDNWNNDFLMWLKMNQFL